MIVVSDTTPLNYLILIESVHVLLALFGRVYAPSSPHVSAPAGVASRSRASNGGNGGLGRGLNRLRFVDLGALAGQNEYHRRNFGIGPVLLVSW